MVISEVVPFNLPKIFELVSCEKAKLKESKATAQISFFIFYTFKILPQNYPEVDSLCVNIQITLHDKMLNNFLKKN